MKNITFCIFAICLTINSYAVNISKKTFGINLQVDSGILISQYRFDQLVDKYILIFQTKDSIKNMSDYITLARLYNTISPSNLYNMARYRKFIDSFSQEYFNLMTDKLEASPRKGSYDYSEKYNLYIGGPLNKNSVFKIIR